MQSHFLKIGKDLVNPLHITAISHHEGTLIVLLMGVERCEYADENAVRYQHLQSLLNATEILGD